VGFRWYCVAGSSGWPHDEKAQRLKRIESKALAGKTQSLKFQFDSDDLPQSSHGLIFHFDHGGGRINMLVEIPEGCTTRDFIGAASDALAWRERLTKWQGEREGKNPLMEELVTWHHQALEDRKSGSKAEAGGWGALAEFVNNRIASILTAHSYANSRQPDWGVYLAQARYIFTLMGFAKTETDEYINDALDNIKNKRRAFPGAQTPIDRLRVRRQIIQYRKRQQAPQK
jgi:hypothetical protein